MMPTLLHSLALLTTALLFGGMLLFAGGFAAFLFTALPMPDARALIRKAFPPFYLFVLGTALVAAALSAPADTRSASLLGLVALTTLPNRQVLMPAVNRATDAGQSRRFAQLHGLSVLVTLAHIAMAGWALLRLGGGI